MSEQLNTIVQMITSIARALKPLIEAAETTEGFVALLDEVGVNPDTDLSPTEQEQLRAALKLVLVPITNPTDVMEVITNLPNVVNTFSANLPSALVEVGEDMINSLIVALLQREAPISFAILTFLGVVALDPLQPSKISGRPRSRWVVNWGLIPGFFSNPSGLFESVYGWGTSHFDPMPLFRNLRNIFLLAGVPAGFQEEDQDNLRAASSANTPLLRVPILVHDEGNASIEAGLALLPTRDPTDTYFDGIVLAPFGFAELSTNIDIGNNWCLSSKGGLKALGGVGLILKSGGHLSIELLDGADGSDVSFNLSVGIAKSSLSGPIVLFGDSDTSRLETGSIGITGKAEVCLSGTPEFCLELYIHAGCLVISTRGSDGFLSKILTQEIKSPFEIVIGFSNLRGVYFNGSAGLEITMPIHASLGPLELELLHVSAYLQTDPLSLRLHMGIDVGLALGPLSASISGIGTKLDVAISQTPDFVLSFLPPTGVGLAVDAEGLIGGGFIEFDTINERYSGILALAFGEISITAIGLIETKMPDGSKNFSMLISICIAFDPPINLSYGFTLSGIGGLIGVNRTMNTEALQRGIKNGTLNTILFPEPEWVILNASQIISDMRTTFPACEGRFVVGPMLKLGWGIPNIITGELGVFLEIPFDQLRFAAMGQMNAAFPDDEFGILVINLDLLGVINGDKKEMSLQASLFDSGIMSSPNPFKISGDAAMLLTWGSKPDFALAVGGFHPKFDPPPPDYIFSDLKRMQLVMTYYVIIKIDCQAYLALTTNSLQFGAKLEVYIKELGAEIGGGVSFDALIIFSPFSFEFSISGYMWVKFQGISLMDIYVTAALSGPNPWTVAGKAKFQIIFDITIPFEISWGDTQQAIIASIDPLPSLKEALGKPGNWSSRLPEGRTIAEQLRPIGEAEDTPDIVIVHPAGRLEVRQNVAPFNVTLEIFGNAPVSGHDRFKIDNLEAGGEIVKTEYVKEFFATCQFENKSDAQKLSLPSFEKMDGGVTTAASQAILVPDNIDSKELGYESILVKADRTSEYMSTNASLPWGRAQGLMAGSAARLSEKNKGANARFNIRNGEPKVTVEEQRYCIVGAADLLPVQLQDGDSAENLFHSRTEADQALKKERSLRAGDGAELLVIAECEIPESEVAA